jgi:hypothetical protein
MKKSLAVIGSICALGAVVVASAAALDNNAYWFRQRATGALARRVERQWKVILIPPSAFDHPFDLHKSTRMDKPVCPPPDMGANGEPSQQVPDNRRDSFKGEVRKVE